MPLRAEYTLHHSNLGDFLSAPVWMEKNGTPLSVLSALARLDLDPWAEGSRMAALSKDAATSRLAAILRQLPEKQPGTTDTDRIADRLVALLPKEGAAAITTAMPINDIAGRMGGAIGGNRWIILALAALLAALVTNGLWF
ncbi:hypothetical protein VH569_28200 [Azospirillum sp. 11R-A]|uniref:hypothetical protein n=1 Tax=Azospirillum sp. 11R-A TaxID=3111634 RepID=UPI003C132045